MAVMLLCQLGKKLWKSIKNEFEGLELVAINFVISEDVDCLYYGNINEVKVFLILCYPKNTLKDHQQSNREFAISLY
jgi:hypothetical protein